MFNSLTALMKGCNLAAITCNSRRQNLNEDKSQTKIELALI